MESCDVWDFLYLKESGETIKWEGLIFAIGERKRGWLIKI